MGEHRRKADGRRVFSTDFKRETVQRIVTGEKTIAELRREFDIAPTRSPAEYRAEQLTLSSSR